MHSLFISAAPAITRRPVLAAIPKFTYSTRRPHRRLTNRGGTKNPELIGVPLGVDRYAQLVGDQVFAALIPVVAGEPGLICGARCRSVGELALATVKTTAG
jgi:hypothetical protein